MVDKVWSKRASQEIVNRLDKLFKNNIIRVRYWIIVNYYAPNHGYNLFFNIYRPYHFTRSISIGQLSNCSFEELIIVLNEIRKKYHFTFQYHHFSKDELQRLAREVNQ